MNKAIMHLKLENAAAFYAVWETGACDQTKSKAEAACVQGKDDERTLQANGLART